MNDDMLQDLLNRADEQYQRAKEAGAVRGTAAAYVFAGRRRAQEIRQRNRLGILTVLFLLGGFSAWSLTGDWRSSELTHDAVATNGAPERETIQPVPVERLAQGRQLPAEEVARLKAEIAALDSEASRAHRFVELLQASELRRERLAQAEAADPPALLSPQALADLQLDRAAATTIVAADAEAQKFNRPADATESYRSVLKYFPQSRWAAVARTRLTIHHMN